MTIEPRRRDSFIVVVVALVARFAVALWAASRFPPAADGTFYHRIAQRIADGLGYTWLWSDGVVTYAGHYPVGYPALIGGAYALFGAFPVVAMALNAVIGSLAAVAVHRLALRAVAPRYALIAGLLVALHPGLVAYTPALMSEGVTASLVTCAAWIAAVVRDAAQESPNRSVWKWLVLLGAVVGVATLVRPQSIVFAPVFALIAVTPWLVVKAWRRVAKAVGVATMAAFVLCTPWTVRNCARMGTCALVSYNGGWNLLIGADTASTGAWSPVKVPETCREVWDEAKKDACFGKAAMLYITEHPLQWISLVPRKLAATFDYCGAAGWYLHESNGVAFDDRTKLTLGVVETAYERLLLALAILWSPKDLFRRAKPLRQSIRARLASAIAIFALAFLFDTHAWVSYVLLVVIVAGRGRTLFRDPVLPVTAVVVVAMTALTHAVFFGAGRYGMVTFPLLAGVAAMALAPKLEGSDAAEPAIMKPDPQ